MAGEVAKFTSCTQWAEYRGVTPGPRLEVVFDVLAHRTPGRLLDLGAGHGKFSIMASDLGWEVTAVDGRTDRFPSARHPQIEWIQSDVREYKIRGQFDMILNLGLLYHLEIADQLALLRSCASCPSLIDTHAAVNAHVEVDGWKGAWFDEDLSQPTASIGNTKSFWPIEPELVRQFQSAGFGAIFRLTPETIVGRTFWLCLPRAADSTLDPTVQEPSRHELAARLRAVEAAAVADAARAKAGATDTSADVARLRAELATMTRRHENLAGHPAVKAMFAVNRGAKKLIGRVRSEG